MQKSYHGSGGRSMKTKLILKSLSIVIIMFLLFISFSAFKWISPSKIDENIENSKRLLLTYLVKDLCTNERMEFRQNPIAYDYSYPVNLKEEIEKDDPERASTIPSSLDENVLSILEERKPILTVEPYMVDESKTAQANNMIQNPRYFKTWQEYKIAINMMKILLNNQSIKQDWINISSSDYPQDFISTFTLNQIRFEPVYSKIATIKHSLFSGILQENFIVFIENTQLDDATDSQPIALMEVKFHASKWNNRLSLTINLKNLENTLMYQAHIKDILFFLENSHLEFSNPVNWQ
jgi:hypothetical protein